MRRHAPLIGYTALALAVAGPLLRPGFLLAVDAAPVPHPTLDGSYWGLGEGTHEGSISRLPLDALLVGLGHLGLTAAGPKLVLLAAILLAGWGMHRGVEVSHPAARVFAGCLYAVNPFVYDRLYTGQLFLLLGYALLPWAFAAFRSALRGAPEAPWRFAALAAATGIASPHMAVLLGGLCACALAAGSLGGGGKVQVRAGAGALGLAALASAFWLVPTPGVLALWSHVGERQLDLYSTVPAGGHGLVAAVAGLSGYWNDARPAVAHLPVWPALALTLAALAAVGAALRRRDPLTWGVAAAGVMGFALALGYAWEPTRAPFAWLVEHVAPLRSMRESQKGVALVAFAYAYLGAPAVDDVVVHTPRTPRARVAIAAVLIAVPAMLGVWTLGGAWGSLKTSHYPASWSRADALLRREAKGSRTLVLPFHGYFALSFAHHRVVANPAPAFFRAPVLAGRSVGGPEDSSDPTQLAVARLLADGGRSPDLAACLAALGVGRVLVLHQADWKRYGFLAARRDFAVESRWSGVTLYRSRAPASLVAARTGRGRGCGAWTPVPAEPAGRTSVRLLDPPPAGAALRVNLANSSGWVRSGDGMQYEPWEAYRRRYALGLLGLLAVLLAWILRRPAGQARLPGRERGRPRVRCVERTGLKGDLAARR